MLENERDMLRAWEKFVQVIDPDFFVGYNITNFDFPYIIDRAKALNLWHDKK